MTNRTAAWALAAGLLAGCGAHPTVKASHADPFDLPTVERAHPGPRVAPVSPARPPAPRVHLTAASLRPYGSCKALVRELRSEALKEVTAYGLQSVGIGYPRMVDGPVMMADGAAPAAAAAAPAPSFSATNNQEADVDEPDLVKTDGTLMVISSGEGGMLRVLDVRGSRPAALGELKLSLGYGSRLLLIGRDVIALGMSVSPQGAPRTIAQVISLTDARHPRVVRTFSVEGSLVDARLLHDRVLLVTQSAPTLPFAYPTDSSPAATAKALDTNRSLIRKVTRADLLPSVTVTPGNRRYDAGCGQTMHPGVPSGLGSTTVTTIDPTRPAPTQSLTVMGSSSVVYASTAALYLATSPWQSQLALSSGRLTGARTDLHGFDVSVRDRLTYLGTGTVTGSLIDQYSMSEHEGYLRVATTVGEPMPATGEGVAPKVASDNRVTVLKPEAGALVKVGQVRGLGRGEKIYGVRFLGDVGYVVTFRQIDPLFVLDLANPRRPLLKGELEVTGYSSALYPLEDGHLLGVGQGVDGHQRPLGTQVSVFDVHRVTHPTLLSRVLISNASSPAQEDHHALLWWPAQRLVVLPVSSFEGNRPFLGAIAYRVSAGGVLDEAGRISAPQESEASGPDYCCTSGIVRTVVIGDLLYSVTDRGLVTAPMDRLDRQAWFPFS